MSKKSCLYDPAQGSLIALYCVTERCNDLLEFLDKEGGRDILQ